MEIEDILEEDLLSMMNDFDMPSVEKKKVVQATVAPEKIDDTIFDSSAFSEDDNEVDIEEPVVVQKKKSEYKQTQNENQFSVSASNVGDLAQLLKELLVNKTIEITIKIKDN